MRIEQKRWTKESGWETIKSGLKVGPVDLVFVFAGHAQLSLPSTFTDLQTDYPGAALVGCSTAGEICSTQVTDESISVTAVQFERSEVKTASIKIPSMDQSHETGRKLAGTIDPKGLRHIFVLSEGIHVNGSALVEGLCGGLPEHVTITGGLSGDGGQFKETFVLTEAGAKPDHVAVAAFYGDHLQIGYSSLGGWDPFGPVHRVTRASENILYELDSQPALPLYKEYLGGHADQLPSSGLLFPLTIRQSTNDEWVVRTLLGVNEEDQSLIFAGDIPRISFARLMKANFERLIEGASGAAQSIKNTNKIIPDLAVLVSCVGRKMILKERTVEEVRAVQKTLGESSVLTGFYSYGEISPFVPNAKCSLHNQTMTITTFSES